MGETIAHSYARKGVETVVVRPSGVVTPEALEEIRRSGGRKPGEWREYSYIDVRDLAVAFRLAVEKPLPGGAVMFVVAEDSTVSEPLCDLLPRLNPAIGDRAQSLTGTRPVFTNAKAKEIPRMETAVFVALTLKPTFGRTGCANSRDPWFSPRHGLDG